MTDLIIVGGGLAGSEAAWQAAERGIKVCLYEMRPEKTTGAHRSGDLGELVCSNSLGSSLADRASGLLLKEVNLLGSLLGTIAQKNCLPAGGAVAVDRDAFSRSITSALENHPNIRIIREEITEIPDSPTILCSGPLTSPALNQSIQNFTGSENLFFYDAIAPVVYRESINMDIAFRASRYEHNFEHAGDYINCPFTQEQFEIFHHALLTADCYKLRSFENDILAGVKAGRNTFFERCLPVEVIAQRDYQALTYGPMRPVGLTDPKTGRWPYAVVQLRQDNLAGSSYNLVGFQTNLTISEQKRVFRLIPGLETAEFSRHGQMHRNTFITSPLIIHPTLQTRQRNDLFFAGQLTGVEGYLGNIATGFLAGVNAAAFLTGQPLITFPQTTMLGALCHYISNAEPDNFQPMKANYGILPISGQRFKSKAERNIFFYQRSIKAIDELLPSILIGEKHEIS